MAVIKKVDIVARDLPEAWFLCILKLFEFGRVIKVDEGSYKGQYRFEFDDVTVHIVYPWTVPMVPIVPEGVPPPADLQRIDDYIPYVLEDVKMPNEDYTYGEDLKWQIEWVINHYKEKGFGNNHCYMTVGSGQSLKYYDRSGGGTSQCLRGIDTKIINNKLCFRIYFRSWDLWGGFPRNLPAFEIMKQYMAGEIGIENGEMIASSMKLHLYDDSWEYAAMVLKKELPDYLKKILEKKRN